MPKNDLIAWNAVISGHSHNGEDMEAVSLFTEMFKEGIGFNQIKAGYVPMGEIDLHDLEHSPQDFSYVYCLFYVTFVPLRWIYYQFKKWHYYLLLSARCNA
nr:pentatricopeptide repeat-containing protein [Quercus suber]